MWMSLAPFWIADISTTFTSWMTGASSPCLLERVGVDLLQLLEHLDVVVGRSSGLQSSRPLVAISSVLTVPERPASTWPLPLDLPPFLRPRRST